jgi:hypothetical protein
MSLRIHGPPVGPQLEAAPGAPPAPAADGWATRLAKLVPAEALGVYGAAAGVVPAVSNEFTEGSRLLYLQVIAAVCLAFCAAIRLKATQAQGGKPQIAAVAISLVSFAIWLAALGPAGSPFPLPKAMVAAPAVAAVLWAGIVSYFYRGDDAPPA